MLLLASFLLLGAAFAVDFSTVAPKSNCPEGYSAIAGTSDCFKVYTISKAYSDAEAICNQDGGNLASIHSTSERQNLNVLLGATSPLIGIKCTTVSSCSWSDGTPMDYMNFIYGQPTLEYGSCAHLFADDDKFYSWNCATPMNAFLCRLDPNNMPADCSPGYTPLGGDCVVLKTVQRSSEDAESECELEGGHLASIHDIMSNSFLLDMLRDSYNLSGTVHIGARYNKNNGVWSWTDGTPFDYTNWVPPTFPDSHFGLCTQFLATDEFGDPGKWTNIPCDTKLPYICMKAQGVSPTYAPLQCPNIQYFEDFGTVYSPGFPLSVPTKLKCEYLLAGDLGTKVVLSFPFFNIDSDPTNSRLTIYDGMVADKASAVLSGSLSFYTFYATQNIVKLVFETSSKTSGEGWEASFNSITPTTSPRPTTMLPFTTPRPQTTPYPWYSTIGPVQTTGYYPGTTAIASDCASQTLYADTQVNSPGFPIGYPRNSNCWFFLSGQPGKRLLLDFEYIDTKKTTDYVSIRDGPYTYSKEIGRVSGKTIDNTLRWISSSNYLTLQFVSDNNKGGTGWTATLDAIN